MAEGVIGYCDPLTVRPGAPLRFHVSSSGTDEVGFTLDFIRIVCADLQPEGDGFRFEQAHGVSSIAGFARAQRIDRGSRIVIAPNEVLRNLGSFTVQVLLWPTHPERGQQVVFGNWNASTSQGFALATTPEGGATLLLGDGTGRQISVSTGVPLRNRAWIRLTASYDEASGTVLVTQDPIADAGNVSPSMGRVRARKQVGAIAHSMIPAMLTIAAASRGEDARGPIFDLCYDGKIEAPRLASSAIEDDDGLETLAKAPESVQSKLLGYWDLAREVDSRTVVDLSGNGLSGMVENLPRRAVIGHNWTGAVHDWREDPTQYGAIHFHSDDLYDAGWDSAAEIVIPDTWRSGIYAACVRAGDNVEYVPFFVAPPIGSTSSDVAFLAPTATYLAYANMFDPIPNSSAPGTRTLGLPAPDFGPSCYHSHTDGSGVHHSSHLRPILNLKPRHTLWGWNADTLVTGWLEASAVQYDVISDHLLHQEGRGLLDSYRVVVTGSHPEYWSTSMREAMEGFLAGGGRLMYLGGNGFYWRTAFSDSWPGAVEVRRAEDGTRTWIAEPGEYHHAWGGELGGLWRRVGRAPNTMVGVGMAGQGWCPTIGYDLQPDAQDPRVAFMFDGVDSKTIGDHGRLGGAAGEEIDRHDFEFGSPPHSLVVASATGFGPEMLKTKEEFLFTAPYDSNDPDIRADVVFFETDQGGAVFSVGSIAWAGSLGRDDYNNDLARLTGNVLRRFRDPEPFPLPAGMDEVLRK